MSGLKIFKELELPGQEELDINSIYLIGSNESDIVEIYITGNQPGVIKRIRNAIDIESIIDQKLINYTDSITYGSTIDLNIEHTGPMKLNTLFIVESDYGIYKANDILLKVSNSSPYFVKINTGGSGGSAAPFEVIEWNPHREELAPTEFVPSNGSTTYSNGTISKVVHTPINLIDFSIGQPNSENIHIINGSGSTATKITLDIVGSDQYARTFGIPEFSSLKFVPLDSFEYNNDGSSKGVDINMIIFQLENEEILENLSMQDIMTKPRAISIYVGGLYQSTYNSYTTISWSITSNGSQVYGTGNMPINGNYAMLKTRISNGKLYLGEGTGEQLLSEYGFDANKKFAAISLLQVNPSNMDIQTSFSIELSKVSINPEISNTYPDYAELLFNENSELFFSGMTTDYSEFFQMNFSRAYEDVSYNYSGSSGGTQIAEKYIDSDRNIRVVVDGNTLKIKNNITELYEDIYTKNGQLNMLITSTSEMYGDTNKSSWQFIPVSWGSVTLLDGVLPSNALDGSTLKVTANGIFQGNELLIDDIVRPYDNKSKILIQRNGERVSNDVLTAGNKAVSGNAVINYSPTADSLSGSSLYVTDKRLNVQIDQSAYNLISNQGNGLFAQLPTILAPYVLREHAQVSNYSSYVQMDLSIRNIFVLNYPYGSIYTYFSNLGSYDNNNAYNTISKVITIIVVNAASVTWPSEIVWADDSAPTLRENRYLVVTGIHVKNAYEENTGGKLLCTYSYFNR